MPARDSRRAAIGAGLSSVVIAAALTWAPPAEAQQDVRQSPPPLVMILMDTSGSMEFANSNEDIPVCTHSCNVDADCIYAELTPEEATGFAGQVKCLDGQCLPVACDSLTNCDMDRARHVTAKEVLTGRFDDYYCEYVSRDEGPTFDNGYPVPHTEARSLENRQLKDTGLIYINRELVRFGFMAFDGDPDGNPGDAFNFPQVPQAPETTNWNLGARGPLATDSPLIPVGNLKSRIAGLKAANDVQDALVSFIPFGSTPLAALFHDLHTYLTNDPNITNDAFSACRPIEIIVITDGQPTFDDCAPGEENNGDARCQDYPYNTTLRELTDLVQDTGANVHVVGFDIDEKEPCRGNAGLVGGNNGLPCIDQMAFVGRTDSNDNPNDETFAYVATDQVSLTRELTKALNKALAGTTARTKVTSSRRTGSRKTSSGLFQVGAAFDVDPNEHLWQGVLERVETRCVGGELQTPIVTDYGKELNKGDLDRRRIFTPFIDSVRNISNDDLDDDDNPNSELEGIDDVNNIYVDNSGSKLINLNANSVLTFQNLLGGGRELDRAFDTGVLPGTDFGAIRALLRGEGERGGRVLGDIFHSNPTIVGGPELQIDIPGYKRFADALNPTNDPRRTMIYVGSNDGMLHAFNGEFDPVNDPVDEVWAFLPQQLQRRIYLQKATRIFGVDGSPVIRDVRLFRGGFEPLDVVDPVGNELQQDGVGFFDIWDTVLVQGLRSGGRSFFSLSVADPESPRFLWELNPITEVAQIKSLSELPEADREITKPFIGLAFGEPALGTVTLKNQEGELFERGIAVVPGGLPADPANPGRLGKVIFIVDLATGKILRRFTKYTPLGGGEAIPFQYAVGGSVALHNDFPGKVANRAFVGDAGGQLLRVDLRASDPALWSVQVFHSSQPGLDVVNRQPTLLRPTISTNRQGQLVVIYGTGDVDDIENRNGGNRIFSLTEVIDINDDGTLGDNGFQAQVNWEIIFSGAEKLTGPPIIFDSVAYFPTFVPSTANACSQGNGRIYGVDFNQVDENNNIIGKFDPNAEAFDEGAQPALVLDTSNAFFSLPAGSVVFGLEIAAALVCAPDVPENLGDGEDFDPQRIDSNQGKLQLLAQTGGSPGSGTLGQGNGSKINTLRFDLQRPPSAIFPRSWSAVLD